MLYGIVHLFAKDAVGEVWKKELWPSLQAVGNINGGRLCSWSRLSKAWEGGCGPFDFPWITHIIDTHSGCSQTPRFMEMLLDKHGRSWMNSTVVKFN